MPNIHITQQFSGSLEESITVTVTTIAVRKLMEKLRRYKTPPTVSLVHFALPHKKGFYLNIEGQNADEQIFLSVHSLYWLEIGSRWMLIANSTPDGVEIRLYPPEQVMNKIMTKTNLVPRPRHN